MEAKLPRIWTKGITQPVWHAFRAHIERALFATDYIRAMFQLPGGQVGILQSIEREDGSGRCFNCVFNVEGKRVTHFVRTTDIEPTFRDESERLPMPSPRQSLPVVK